MGGDPGCLWEFSQQMHNQWWRWSLISFFLLTVWLSSAKPTRAQEAVGLSLYFVKADDTLESIAAELGMTPALLRSINALTEPRLTPGQDLLVPLMQTVFEHRVRAGDTLYGIANLYDISASEIAAFNDMQIDDIIYVGQLLRLRAPFAAANGQLRNPFLLVHSVAAGESLSQIAVRYAIPLAELAAANEMEESALLPVGARLRIPGWEVPLAPAGLPVAVEAVELRPATLSEGRIVRLRLQTKKPATLSARFLGREITAHAQDDGHDHYLLLPAPMFTEPGLHFIDMKLFVENEAEASFSLQVQVLSGHYPEEQITLLPDRAELLSSEIEEAEDERVRNVMSFVQPWRSFGGGMQAPAAGSISSYYGSLRSYNGGPFNRFHSGTDYDAPRGSVIFAAAPGRVVLVERLAIRGLASIIDHGWGVYTGYWHQENVTVGLGQQVNAGQIIGAVGRSGRVSGAHLHWELWVNGVPVDPLQWLEEPFP